VALVGRESPGLPTTRRADRVSFGGDVRRVCPVGSAASRAAVSEDRREGAACAGRPAQARRLHGAGERDLGPRRRHLFSRPRHLFPCPRPLFPPQRHQLSRRRHLFSSGTSSRLMSRGHPTTSGVLAEDFLGSQEHPHVVTEDVVGDRRTEARLDGWRVRHRGSRLRPHDWRVRQRSAPLRPSSPAACRLRPTSGSSGHA
jgi:hypothetical protein